MNVSSSNAIVNAERSSTVNVRQRANALAERLEQGARALASFASGLTAEQWQVRLPGDGRKVGVVVHHVASVYPVEIQLAQAIAAGNPVVGVTKAVIDDMNAGHASQHAGATKEAALALLRQNSAPPRQPSGRSATRSSTARSRCRSMPMRRSRASSFSKITPSGIAITISPGFERRWRSHARNCHRQNRSEHLHHHDRARDG